MTLFLIFITGLYLTLMLALLIGWRKIPEFKLKHAPSEISFSIIIPYRNEAENLPVLLNSILKLKYPLSLFEILLVNDSSEDGSEKICSHFKTRYPELQISLLENQRLSGSPKKDAILTGIKMAIYPYILTTDADCELPPFWLQAFNEKILETGAKLIAGPVSTFKARLNATGKYLNKQEIKKEKRRLKYFHAFQEMDFLSLQIAGAGGFGLEKAFMCNGANLCYNKSAFFELDGFSGNGEISSGDDVFLLQKFTEKKLKIAFLKCEEAIVLTKPQKDLSALISQRIRWAAKTPAYKSLFAKSIGFSVLLMNFSLILGSLLTFFDFIPYQPVLLAFFFKFNMDFALLFYSAEFFNRKDILRNYFWSSLVYPVFSTSVAFMSLFKKFEWKGRKFRS
ncbi:glycosyltransferase [Gillisia sp. Q332]|uniref:glycosyltransferase n=1 Tax=Gillisia xinjiangensis TaxID=3384765 RepID=UPI00391DBCDA